MAPTGFRLRRVEGGWTEMEKLMPLPDLRAGYDDLHFELEGVVSKYSYVKQPVPDMDDSLPEFEDKLPAEVAE
jgi:hypothetical protein